jgi:hypothetical protein
MLTHQLADVKTSCTPHDDLVVVRVRRDLPRCR